MKRKNNNLFHSDSYNSSILMRRKSVGIIPSSETPDSAAGVYHKISSEEAKIMMESGGVTVVDVRRPEEYARKTYPRSNTCVK